MGMILLSPFAEGRQGKGPKFDETTYQRVAKSMSGRMVQVELLKTTGGEETVLQSIPGVVISTKHVMSIVPRIEKLLAEEGVSLRVVIGRGGSRRILPASLVKTDYNTALAVVEARDLRGKPFDFRPSPPVEEDTRVFLVEPQSDGRLSLRPGHIQQARSFLDQGRGKNPLLLFKLDSLLKTKKTKSRKRDPDGGRGARADELSPEVGDLSENYGEVPPRAGAYLADSQGRFLGIVTPPKLHGRELSKNEQILKRGQSLALPAGIARLVAESLIHGKSPVRGYLGVSFRLVENPPADAIRLGIARPCFKIRKVYSGSPAEAAGLKKGDLILSVGPRSAFSYQDMMDFWVLVEYIGEGQTIQFTVAREVNGVLKSQRLRIKIGRVKTE